jgi:cobalt-precorrin 5A hydrolase
MIVAGIGCRRGAPVERIEDVLAKALATYGLPQDRLEALASAADKADEPGLRALSRRRRLPLRLASLDDLAHAADRIMTRSQRVIDSKSVPSIAEASALAIAGASARLLGPRVSNECATCAIAVGDEP